jgi:hypothetical protein
VRSRVDHEALRALDLTALTAAEIDERWATIYDERARVEAKLAAIYRWARDLRAKTTTVRSEFRSRGKVEAELAIRELNKTEAHFTAEWDDRGGWERVYLVTNHDGHYHRTMACSTTYSTTQWAWVPTLSDKTEDEVIAAVADRACTVCWPNAPRHPKFIEAERNREARAAEEAESICAGSGEYVEWTGRRYQPCPVCGASEALTASGKVRKHKTRLAKHLDKRAKQMPNDERAWKRLETLAHKVNAAIDRYGNTLEGLEAAYLGVDSMQVTDSVREIIEQRKREQRRRTV